MEKEKQCNCKSDCTSRRCACFKNNEPCDERCGCTQCKNPLNGVDTEQLTDCAIQNIKAYKALTPQQLAEEYELPCGDQSVPLQKLLDGFECEECNEDYWYSFCWHTVYAKPTAVHEKAMRVAAYSRTNDRNNVQIFVPKDSAPKVVAVFTIEKARQMDVVDHIGRAFRFVEDYADSSIRFPKKAPSWY